MRGTFDWCMKSDAGLLSINEGLIQRIEHLGTGEIMVLSTRVIGRRVCSSSLSV